MDEKTNENLDEGEKYVIVKKKEEMIRSQFRIVSMGRRSVFSQALFKF